MKIGIINIALITAMVVITLFVAGTGQAQTPPHDPPDNEKTTGIYWTPGIKIIPGAKPVKQLEPLVKQEAPLVNQALQYPGPNNGHVPLLHPAIHPPIPAQVLAFAEQNQSVTLVPVTYWWINGDGADGRPYIYWTNPSVQCSWYDATIQIQQWGTGTQKTIPMGYYLYDSATNTCWWRPKNMYETWCFWWKLTSSQINTNPPTVSEIDPNYRWLGCNFMPHILRGPY